MTGYGQMQRAFGRGTLALCAMLGATMLAGCGSSDPQLMNLRSNGPDEFGILPAKPLEAPSDFSALPPPTPGGANRTDPTPQADAIAALGGNPAAVSRSGVPAADGGLISYAGRYGVQSNIRQTLAAADLEFRQGHRGRLLERLANLTTYYRVYAPFSLDQHAELRRLRQQGVKTPAAPPDPTLKK